MEKAGGMCLVSASITNLFTKSPAGFFYSLEYFSKSRSKQDYVFSLQDPEKNPRSCSN